MAVILLKPHYTLNVLFIYILYWSYFFLDFLSFLSNVFIFMNWYLSFNIRFRLTSVEELTRATMKKLTQGMAEHNKAMAAAKSDEAKGSIVSFLGRFCRFFCSSNFYWYFDSSFTMCRKLKSRTQQLGCEPVITFWRWQRLKEWTFNQ